MARLLLLCAFGEFVEYLIQMRDADNEYNAAGRPGGFMGVMVIERARLRGEGGYDKARVLLHEFFDRSLLKDRELVQEREMGANSSGFEMVQKHRR